MPSHSSPTRSIISAQTCASTLSSGSGFTVRTQVDKVFDKLDTDTTESPFKPDQRLTQKLKGLNNTKFGVFGKGIIFLTENHKEMKVHTKKMTKYTLALSSKRPSLDFQDSRISQSFSDCC